MSAGGDRARALVRDAGGDALVERLDHLDRTRRYGAPPPDEPCRPPDRGARTDFDVAFFGGGLSLLMAPLLARRGLRVGVFDRARAASGHREWNASLPELVPLVTHRIVDEHALEELIVARYREGVCRFHDAGSYPVRGVLDHAVDAQGLLDAVRAGCEALGVTFFDGRAVMALGAGPDAVAFRTRGADGSTADHVTRIAVDARGSSSPYASADLVCPTVGGVVEGLVTGEADDEMNPDVGDILATIDDADDGPQHVWEAFPGRRGQTTVYLFHYAKARRSPSLLELYARFFQDLPRYKRGDARLVRPTFGFIPGWSRLSAAPRSPSPRVVLVGDAAARHSPLTLCGFGAALRSFAGGADRIADAVDSERALRDLGGVAAHDCALHSLTGALAAVMASSDRRGHAVNALLGAAFGALHAMGNEAYAALLRDELDPRRFALFLRSTARVHPQAYADAFRDIGPLGLARWSARLARALLA